jgi:predicted transcriptional regulator
MAKQQYYLPVHWVDGMKINKNHFIDEQNARVQAQALSSGSHINHINYGLLPPVAWEHSSIKLFINLDNQQNVTVQLLNCRAVTPGGHIINIEQAADDDFTAVQEKINGLSVSFSELKTKAETYYVVLSINPYKRVPTGNASEDEMPPRIPFTLPQYNLSLMPEEDLAYQKIGLFHLVIGKFFIREQNIQVDLDYIPPCSTSSSHPELIDVFAGMEAFMSKMELYCTQILQKIIQKKQQNELAQIVQRICENILQYTNSHAMIYRWSMLHQPPLHMLSMVASMARVMKNTLDQYLGSGKEELINYFMEWCELKQGELENLITNLTNHKYIHENINDTVQLTASFTKSISTLFHNLSRLDYIGKKKDSNIFVKEEMVKSDFPELEVKKRRSFLAD